MSSDDEPRCRTPRNPNMEEVHTFVRALTGLPPGGPEPTGWSVRAVTDLRSWEDLCIQAAWEMHELMRAAQDMVSMAAQDRKTLARQSQGTLLELLHHTRLLAPYMGALIWRLWGGVHTALDVGEPPDPPDVFTDEPNTDLGPPPHPSLAAAWPLLPRVVGACRELIAARESLTELAGSPEVTVELCQRAIRFERARAWVGYMGFRAWAALLSADPLWEDGTV